MQVNCSFCLASMAEKDASFEYKVWVSGPKKDGATLRTPTGRAACESCMTAMKAGQAPDQQPMFKY